MNRIFHPSSNIRWCRLLTVAAALFLSVTSTTASSIPSQTESTTPDAQPSAPATNYPLLSFPKANLVIIRGRGSAPIAYKPTVIVSGKPAFLLPSGGHANLSLAAGRHKVVFDWKSGHVASDRSITVTLAPNTTTYIRLQASLTLPVLGGSKHEPRVVNEDEINLYETRLITQRSPGWYIDNAISYEEPPFNIQAIINGLKSEDYARKRIAARRITKDGLYTAETFKALDEEIRKRYKSDLQSKLEIDSVAWLCRALAQSGDEGFRPTIELVAREATSKEIRKYAKSYTEEFYKKPKKKRSR